MSYGPNVSDLYRRAATFVDRIFKGAKPAPPEAITTFEWEVILRYLGASPNLENS